ncbi:MAG: methyltransferase domain-containing protein [Euryarchaeota archaeon]|nr:methyltransferase domain-containing protein [Euryarchaeota archaeon]MDE1835152.1 methyltransferase domain-containing protein [Euryarchaeota archaeon]MDE2046199.1 methyltransferase domain-containing protein [Thermoplasmata archaeon]
MRAQALTVERAKGEQVRRALVAGGWLRGDLRPKRSAIEVVYPIVGLPADLPPGVEGILSEEDFEPSGEKGPRDYHSLVDLPEPLRQELPSSFDVVGDIVLIRLPDVLLPHRRSIGAALLSFVPGCRKVGLDRGVEGVARLRSLEEIAGEGSWATVHRENGISLAVDLEHAYFSPRLASEHARVASLVTPGERLLDLFCGVGPFCLTALRAQKSATALAVDLNPSAVALLRENARRLRVQYRLEVLEADAEDFLRRDERFSRVVMNLPREGYMYVAKVARHVMPAGTLHHYEVVPRARAAERLRELSTLVGPEWSVDTPRVVHAYNPTSDLLAWTLHRGA